MATILITGAGGASVPGLIEGLRAKGYRVIAADMDRHAVGLYMADSGYIIPAGNASNFVRVIRQICREAGVHVFVPLVDEELLPAQELERDGVAVLTPRREFIETCLDKYRLMRRLESVGIAVSETRLASEGAVGMTFPLVVKPRRGRGSRGVRIVDSHQTLREFIESSSYGADDLLLQGYIDGTEYTVSVVVGRNGKVQAVVPKEVIFKKGITKLAVTRRHEGIERLCHKIQEQLRGDGPFNVQLRTDRYTGVPLPFEINPRFSTTISLTIAAGIDELEGLIIQALKGSSSYMFGEWKEGVVLLRRTFDQFVDEQAFREIRPKEVLSE